LTLYDAIYLPIDKVIERPTLATLLGEIYRNS